MKIMGACKSACIVTLPSVSSVVDADISRTGQTLCYVAKNVYDVPRLHNTCVMFYWERSTRTNTA